MNNQEAIAILYSIKSYVGIQGWDDDHVDAMKLAISALESQIDTNLLTLDDLQEMDGKSVTIYRYKTITVPDFDKPEQWVVDNSKWNYKDYGKTWTAYETQPQPAATGDNRGEI